MSFLPDSTKKLGFGLMRLPVLGGDDTIDLKQLNEMVDHFLEQGFTYFDTAYPYHMGFSERAVKSALVERHPRDSFLLADKSPSSASAAPRTRRLSLRSNWSERAPATSISICCTPWVRSA